MTSEEPEAAAPETAEFTTEMVMHAVEALQTSPEAVAYLTAWASSPNPEVQAVEMLQGWASNESVFHAFTVTIRQLKFFYGRISPETKFALAQLINWTFSDMPSRLEVHILRAQLIQCYSLLAVYEFPENECLAPFQTYAFMELTEYNIWATTSLNILAVFLKELETSKLVTEQRKMGLRMGMMERAPDLLGRVHFAFGSTTEDDVKSGLAIMCFLVRNSSIDDAKAHFLELIHRICFEFIFIEDFTEEALSVLKGLLLERRDKDAFSIFAPLVLQGLGNPTAVNNQGTAVLTITSLQRFVMDVMNVYGVRVIKALMGDPESAPIMEAAAHVGLPPQDLQGSIMNILGQFLSFRDPECFNNRHFYEMWSSLIRAAAVPAREDKPAYMQSFMSVIIDPMIQHFFEMIPCAVGDYGECPTDAMRLWSSICGIHPEVAQKVIAFIRQKEPSPELCYAVSNLRFANASHIIQYAELTLLFRELNEHIQGCDVDYLIAALNAFGCSASVGQEFLEIVLKCLTEIDDPDHRVGVAAAYAFDRSVWQLDTIPDEALQAFCENSETFVVRLSIDASVRVFKVCATLINRTRNPEKIAHFSQILMRPIAGFVSVWQQLSGDQIRLVLDVITEVCYALDTNTHLFVHMFMEPFGQLARGIITRGDASIVENCVAACGAIMATQPFNVEIYHAIIEMMMERGRLELCFMDFVAICRAAHMEMNAAFDTEIIPTFIGPALADENTWPNLLHMIRYFTFDATQIPDFWRLCFSAIQSYDDETNREAARAVKVYLTQLTPDVMIHILPDLITSLMAAITDMMHINSIKEYSSLLAYIYLKGMVDETVIGQVVHNVAASLLTVIGAEPDPQFFMRFATHLFEIRTRRGNGDASDEFYNAIAHLLVMLRKLSNCDVDAFSAEWEEGVNPLIDPDRSADEMVVTNRILPVRKDRTGIQI